MESQFAAVTPRSPSPVKDSQIDLKTLSEFARRARDVNDFITQIREARREKNDYVTKHAEVR